MELLPKHRVARHCEKNMSLDNVQALDSNLSQVRETNQNLVKTKIFLPYGSQIMQTLALFSTLE